MKKNSIIIVLIIVILVLISYIFYLKKSDMVEVEKNKEIKIVKSLDLSYAEVLLTNEGIAYLRTLNSEEIKLIDGGKNLKERLETLNERAFYYDIFIDNNQLKGYKISLDDKIVDIVEVEYNSEIYLIFIKENNTIGVMNFNNYYNLFDTKVIDNYNNIENVSKVVNGEIIYLDGSKEIFIP